MTKPCNFPGRRNKRRYEALERERNKYPDRAPRLDAEIYFLRANQEQAEATKTKAHATPKDHPHD
jgi:hypothetical protein